MGDNRSFQDIWTRILFDEQMAVLEIINPDDRLFFDRRPKAGQRLAEAAGKENRKAAETIVENMRRACREKRNVRFQYHSTGTAGAGTYVNANVGYGNDGTHCLYLTALDQADMRPGVETAASPAKDSMHDLLNTIYENLPIGVEIYDRDGRMLEVNPAEMKAMGISSKEDVVGINLFENPNLPDDVSRQLKAGEDAHFSIEYDFGLVHEYYQTSNSQVRNLEVAITVVRDAKGETDKFLIISQDVTDRIQLQRKYERLYNQNLTVLNSLPVGVGIYDNAGKLVYFNEQLCRIFGVEEQHLRDNPTNLTDNPAIPVEIPKAIQAETPIHINFPYDFDVVREEGSLLSTHSDIRQIDCNGRPVFNASGKLENYVFIINDITEATRNEEELRQSKLKTELAIRESDIMLWEFDVERQLFFSDNEPMNGYDNSQPISLSLYSDTIHPEDRSASDETLKQMSQGMDISFAFDCRVRFPDTQEWQYCSVSGSPYEKDENGKVVKFVGTRKNNTEMQKRKYLQEKILNSIPLPIHIKDVEDNFRYVFTNDESKRMFGTSEEKTTYDVMPREEVERIQKTDLEVFNTGKPYLGLERIVLKDGRSYDTIVRKSVIHDGNKRLLLNIRWDQSLQKDLERRAKVLSLTMEAMEAYTWFFEPGKNRVSFGEGFDKICPVASQVNSLEKFAAKVHPEDRQHFIGTMESLLLNDNGQWSVEYRADLNNDGIYEWWETRGILETTELNDAPYKYMFGMSICIQNHKQTELTLLRNKEELNNLIQQNELVLNNTNSGLAYITTDYIVQWENISMCSASLSYEAYKKGELCYKSAHNRTSPCENCVMQRAARSGQMERIKFRLDNHHMVEVLATPVLNDDKTVDGIVIRVDDVTERERMINELKKAKTQAEQSDKLKSAFLANMSHEIRTPLNAIVGFSELLMSTTEEEEKEEYIRIINNNNELLLKLINDILDLSKIEAGSVELKYEEFDLSEYFDGMEASMRQRVANPNVRLIAVNPYPVCRVNLDRNRIAQILTNYVTNAIKYTPKGFIEMGYTCTDTAVRFYVKDSGIGIADEKKSKVFHRFEKLDEFAQGTGLGLSICKAIAESMGGSVGFESTHGEGSLFWASLPCEPDIEDGRTQPEETPGASEIVAAVMPTTTADSGRKTILVAEDIPSNFLLLSAMLQKRYNLLHAMNGEQAVEMARTHEVDLLLMDMKMPVMDGLTATAEIRKFDQQLPIVALTAHAFESDRLAALAAGCNGYLVKPIDKAQLMTVLRKYCGNDPVTKNGK